MAGLATITVRVADAEECRTLFASLVALLDKLDDTPEGSGLDHEWIAWMGEMCELRDRAHDALTAVT
jgi:hypothetical protein